MVNPIRKDWSSRLDEALLAYHMPFKTPLGMSPFKLVYGKPCLLPVELEYKTFWDIKKLNMNLIVTGHKRLLQLNEMEEFQAQAYENVKLYNEKTKCWHDKRIMLRQFDPGQSVLFNFKLKLFPSKLKSRWAGPFEVAQVYPHGAIDVKDMKTRVIFKVNGQCLKHY
ncbi:uncharacterized protein LOC105795927 [Gossypium raimondii]|uniref:uncharacterized protein LOC105795927 n=1 Tax=Gossypium raimondii TaxID=29730 RepID=UPI00063AE99A|nr:uncharacterized protein LOC105795927 [Gossypium raimondii]